MTNRWFRRVSLFSYFLLASCVVIRGQDLITGVENLDEADIMIMSESSLRKALTSAAKDKFPEKWASLQFHLGWALENKSKLVPKTNAVAILDEGLIAFNKAAAVNTRERKPFDWAMTQKGIGVLLCTKAKLLDRTEAIRLLNESISAFRRALNVITRGSPDWSRTQIQLATALYDEAEIIKGAKGQQQLLTEVITIYREIIDESLHGKESQVVPDSEFHELLQGMAHDVHLENTAEAQYNLGIALSTQARNIKTEEAVGMLNAAESAFREALKIYTEKLFPEMHSKSVRGLESAEAQLKKLPRNDKGRNAALATAQSDEGPAALDEPGDVLKAVYLQDPDLLKQAFRNRSEVNAAWGPNRSTPLHIAAIRGGNLEIVNLLLQSGAKPNARDKDDNTPLHYALAHKFQNIAQALIKAGANVNLQNRSGNTPLHAAASAGDAALANLLLHAASSINVTNIFGSTPLHCALAYGTEEVALMLIEKGAVLITSTNGITQLHVAVIREMTNAVSSLIALGADPNARDATGRTPLHHAALRGNLVCLSALIKAGANLDIQDSDSGESALHLALYWAPADVATALVSAGANVNLADKKNYNPVHYAAFQCNTNVAALLFKAGAELNRTNNDGMTPMDIVRSKGAVLEVERAIPGVLPDKLGEMRTLIAVAGLKMPRPDSSSGHDFDSFLTAHGAKLAKELQEK